jgi:hypothetical protein
MRETEKLAAFLRDSHPERFCVGCLGRQLHLTVAAVTSAAIELGLTTAYRFGDGTCSRCGRPDTLLGFNSPPD